MNGFWYTLCNTYNWHDWVWDRNGMHCKHCKKRRGLKS